MGKTRVVFIDPGAKVNSSYYCNIVLEKGLLPVIRTILSSLQVDTAAGWSASAHLPDHDMDYYMNKEHNFIEPHMGPPNSPDINPVHGLRYLGCYSATSLLSTTKDNSRRWNRPN